MSILIYHDDSKESIVALLTGAQLAVRLGRPFTVMTCRSGTFADEKPPEYGRNLAPEQWEELSPGLKLLVEAARALESRELLPPFESIRVKEKSASERVFSLEGHEGTKIWFLVKFGRPFDVVKEEIYSDDDGYDLLVLSASGTHRLLHIISSNLAHSAAVDLMVSLLAVKGEHLDSRVYLCADGTRSARRAYPVLNWMLPALNQNIDVIGVTETKAAETLKEACVHCAQRARAWLESEDKKSQVLIREGKQVDEVILKEAGDDAIIVMGASLRSDFNRRLKGSVPLRVIEKGKATVLLAKSLPEDEMPVDWGEGDFPVPGGQDD